MALIKLGEFIIIVIVLTGVGVWVLAATRGVFAFLSDVSPRNGKKGD